MSSRSIARSGLCCALLVASAWVSIPFGPVPFTLQTLVVALLPQVLPPRDAVLTVVSYVLLGCVGLPVFSSFQGGIGVLAGPTGGFIWGFILSMVPAAAIMHAGRLSRGLRVPLGAAVLLVICYVLGCAQLMLVSGMGLPAALAAAVLPFVIPDLAKVAVSMALARAVNRVLSVEGAAS